MSVSRHCSLIPEMRRMIGRGPLDSVLAAWPGRGRAREEVAVGPQTATATSRCSATSSLVALLLSNTTGRTVPILESSGGVDAVAAFRFLFDGAL